MDACASGHADVVHTPYRSLTDRFSMFVDTTNVPSGRTSYWEMLDKFGVIGTLSDASVENWIPRRPPLSRRECLR